MPPASNSSDLQRATARRRHEYLHYYWQRSHQGQLPEAAADALAKARLAGDPVPVPKLPGGGTCQSGCLYANSLIDTLR